MPAAQRAASGWPLRAIFAASGRLAGNREAAVRSGVKFMAGSDAAKWRQASLLRKHPERADVTG
jgi:hypothetical protein